MAMNARRSPSILMLPWLGHGHVSPFLELAKKLSKRNFHIYFCSTPIILQGIRETLDDELFPSIQLVELHLPSSTELPPHCHTTKALPRHLVPSLITAFDQSKPSFSAIIRTCQPDLLIYDVFQPWAPVVAREENVKGGSILFLIYGASFSFMFGALLKNVKKINEHDKSAGYLLRSANGVVNADRHSQCFDRSSEVMLVKTSKEIEIEEKQLHSLSGLFNKKFLTTGLLLQESDRHRSGDDKIMHWIDSKDPCSVVFVAFGSECYLSKEQLEEMAYGLELSQVNFVWVLRFYGEDEKKHRSNIDEALPGGFLQRMEESKRGIVVQGWAPQVRILSRENIGCFVSHCGSSSLFEAITLAVPIIAMPLEGDHSILAKIAVEMGMAMEVERDEGKTIIKRENVARAIQQVVYGEEGKLLRRRAKELSERVREKDDEELNQAAEELRRLWIF